MLAMKLQRTTLISHLNHLMGLLVIAAMAAFLIWSIIHVDQASDAVQASTLVVNTYQQLGSTLTQEQALLSEYTLDPHPTLFAQHQAAAATIVGLVHTLQRDSEQSDALFERQFLAEQANYVAASSSLFSAIDAH